MRSARFLAAFSLLPEDIRRTIVAWSESFSAVSAEEALRGAILADNHLDAAAFSRLLAAIAERILSGEDWQDGFRRFRSGGILRGDEITLEIEVLDRVVPRAVLELAYDVPSFAVGSSMRYHGENIPGALAAFKFARESEPVFCTFVAAGLTVSSESHSSPTEAAGKRWYEPYTARAICELLGLGHVRPGRNLVMLTYRRPSSLVLRYPTVVDACGDRYFATSLPTDPCGMTKHLRTAERALPEAVHENLEIDHLLITMHDFGPA